MIQEGLTYDDVLLVPKYSTVESRSQVDLSVKIERTRSHFKHPIIPANMQSVTGESMAKFVADGGGLAIVHRFMPLEEQLDMINKFVLMTEVGTPDYMAHIGFSVGVKKENREDIDSLVGQGAEILCIDIAHGDSLACINTTEYIKKKYPHVLLIAGNVASGSGAKRLWKAGADVVKVGVGPGSLCTTRIETGNGTPQLSALMDVYDVKKELEHDSYLVDDRKFYFIADGGIKSAGDIVKALCFADMVMVGSLFAGHDESPGKVCYVDGVPHKEYSGSSTHKTNRVEGVSTTVPCKGSVSHLLTKLLEGIQSGCSYQGAHNLLELKNNPTFIRITSAGLRKSHPHLIAK